MTHKSTRHLEDVIGHRFADATLLETALTHASRGNAANYERLEFLGDRVLSLVIAELIYKAYPAETEGDLARRHAVLVQAETLAGIARALDLGSCMRFSDAERAAGGAANENILADGFEALIGALYLDAGLEPCARLIAGLWQEPLRTMTAPPRDSKTALQEWAQGRGLKLPVYSVAVREGPDHAPLFHVDVAVEGFAPARAQGSSRRAAEKEAARLLLLQIGEAP